MRAAKRSICILLAAMPCVVAAEPAKEADVTVLTESLNPLRDHFNAHRDKHRFIAILSPT